MQPFDFASRTTTHGTYVLSGWLFLRLPGPIYFAAFVSLGRQIKDGSESATSGQRHGSGVNRVPAQQLFDAQELIVFRQPIRAAERTGLDLSRIGGDRDVGNRGVFGFSRAMADDSRVTVFLRQLDGVECLRE